MKKSIRNTITVILTIAFIILFGAFGSTAYSQTMVSTSVAVSGGVGSSSSGSATKESTVALPFTPSALTNRAELASLALRNVDHIVIGLYNAANAGLAIPDNRGGDRETFIIPFNHVIKSFSTMNDLIKNSFFGFNVFDITKPTYVEVEFTRGYPHGEGYKSSPSFQVLFAGNSGGKLVEGKNGFWTLDPVSSHIQMRLNYSVRMYLPGLVAGKAVHMNPGGGSYANRLNVYRNSEFDLPVEIVGSGVLVLAVDNGDGRVIQPRAIDMVTGKDMPLSAVLINVLLEGSREIYPFVDPERIDITQDSYFRYGINPLIIVKNTRVATASFSGTVMIPLNLKSTEGFVPTSFKVVNIATGEEKTVTVPNKGEPAQLFLGFGEYHIIPNQFLGGRVGGEKREN